MGVGATLGAALAVLSLVYLAACILLFHTWQLPAVHLPFQESDEILAKFNDSCLTGKHFFFLQLALAVSIHFSRL